MNNQNAYEKERKKRAQVDTSSLKIKRKGER
jgi:hypothetical protein